MGAIISNIVPACGVWLFGPNLVHIKIIVLLEYGYLVPNECIYLNHHYACGMWLFGLRWVQLSRTLFMLLEYGYLVPNECNLSK
jgi:hypothetical protein